MTKKAIKHGHRPPFVPMEEQCKLVQGMVAFGIPQERIAKHVISPVTGKPITAKTLARAFRREIDTGKDTMISNVATSLYNKAMGKGAQSVTACIFILKTQAGWRDKLDVNLDFTDRFAEKLGEALGRLNKERG